MCVCQCILCVYACVLVSWTLWLWKGVFKVCMYVCDRVCRLVSVTWVFERESKWAWLLGWLANSLCLSVCLSVCLFPLIRAPPPPPTPTPTIPSPTLWFCLPPPSLFRLAVSLFLPFRRATIPEMMSMVISVSAADSGERSV